MTTHSTLNHLLTIVPEGKMFSNSGQQIKNYYNYSTFPYLPFFFFNKSISLIKGFTNKLPLSQ